MSAVYKDRQTVQTVPDLSDRACRCFTGRFPAGAALGLAVDTERCLVLLLRVPLKLLWQGNLK